MTDPSNRGLGRPNGPGFLGPFGPATEPSRPPMPAAGPPATGGTRRVVVIAALVAALVGGTAGAVGWLATGASDPGPTLPRVALAPGGAAAGGQLAEVASAVLPGVVSVQVRDTRGAGSGFVIDDRGHVMTNAHVVGGASQVQVVLAGGRQVPATVVGTDPGTDIAVIRLSDTAGLRPLPLGQSDQLRVGDTVLAVGSPLGLSGTVTAGIVSALDREARLGEDNRRQTAIQTDASINPGNSGGPLINTAGQVVRWWRGRVR